MSRVRGPSQRPSRWQADPHLPFWALSPEVRLQRTLVESPELGRGQEKQAGRHGLLLPLATEPQPISREGVPLAESAWSS